MFELTGVSKNYTVGGQVVTALDTVDLQVELGSFTSVIGPSGSGKSTLLHIMGTLDAPDSGTVHFAGQNISELKDNKLSEFRRRNIGFIFQFFNLLPAMTAWENIALPLLLDGGTLKKAKPAALELLELVGLENRAEHRPAELSGGQMQRVAVARSLVMNPSVILADEPSGNLDSESGQRLIELLSALAHDIEKPRAIVMVTHSADAAAVSDRVITLRDGRVTSDVVNTGTNA